MGLLLKSLTLVFLAFMPVFTNGAGVWWAIAFSSSANENQVHGPVNIVGSALSPKQLRIIKNQRSPQLLAIIARGARMAIMECQRQFKNRRWNCSSNNPYNVFGGILAIACRETAFAYAITAAVVSHSISRACTDGELRTCTCDNNYKEGEVTREGWQWGGCSDNIRFADKFARRFLNSGIIYQDFRARVNIHNNEAGKAAVRNNMNLECKCYGLSQACTVKTCWKRIPDFRRVGEVLKERFDGASRVEIQQNTSGKKFSFIPVNKLHKPPTTADLIYYEKSPDFCSKNSRVGSLGTVGRECNQTSMGTGGCDLLCCSRGHKSEWRMQSKPCNCKFFWCCQVACETCNETRNVHSCL